MNAENKTQQATGKPAKTTMCDCGHVATSNGCSAGYGVANDGKRYCFACCGERDKADMIETGKAVLYLAKSDEGDWNVSNWPGSLSIPCEIRVGKHNIAGTRYDCWFTGPDGKQWHGVNYGENSQLCYCRRLKG